MNVTESAPSLVTAPHASPTPAIQLLPGMSRAFERSDFAPVPHGWHVGGPDFVAVGCGRAGSTWWWSLLENHPDVHANRLNQKELHYFVHFGWDGPDAEQVAVYREAFARPEGGVCGDGSFNYLYHPLAMQHLWTAAPDAKLIVLVRNPIDRLLSTYDMFLRRRLRWLGLEGERAAVQSKYSLWAEAVTCCHLADGVRTMLKRWPIEQILILQYEQCRLDPRTHLARTYDFLGIDSAFVPRDLTASVNGDRHEIAPPDAPARARLAEMFEIDVDLVCTMLPEIDRSLWPDFA